MVLVGPQRYLGAVLGGLIAFGAPMILIGVVSVIALPDLPGLHRGPIVVSMALGLVTFGCWRPVVRHLREPAIVPSVLIVTAVLGYQVSLYGPRGGEAATLFIAATVVAALWVPRRWAVAAVAVGATIYGGFLAGGDYPAPGFRWVSVVSAAVVVLFAIARVLDLIISLSEEQRAKIETARRLALAERDSAREADQAREALAVLNDVLEERVLEQVEEIDRLGELRRFLSAQVADAVLAERGGSGGPSALTPHRRDIAVVFVDLRGFTSFSSTAEPEEILEVLDGYYEQVGEAVREAGATVGAFQGDGIMAYLNDPYPCEDPPGTAIAMTLALRPSLDSLCVTWARRGFDLGYGIGVAYGEATLGSVGFEGRSDYTPLGAVVNRAAELCDAAHHGEILFDQPTLGRLTDPPPVELCRLQLKSFEGMTPALRIAAEDG